MKHGDLGVDVSPTYQPRIDWPAVADAGYSFAILKATEGTGFPPHDDATLTSWLLEQAGAAAAAGVDVAGAYHFARPHEALLGQAAFFAERWHELVDRGHTPRLAIVDAEDAGGLDPEHLVGWLDGLAGEIERRIGRPVVIYTYPSFLEHELAGKVPGRRRLWLADYRPAPRRPCVLWQYCAAARVPGIAGEVDTNVWLGASDTPTQEGTSDVTSAEFTSMLKTALTDPDVAALVGAAVANHNQDDPTSGGTVTMPSRRVWWISARYAYLAAQRNAPGVLEAIIERAIAHSGGGDPATIAAAVVDELDKRLTA